MIYLVVFPVFSCEQGAEIRRILAIAARLKVLWTSARRQVWYRLSTDTGFRGQWRGEVHPGRDGGIKGGEEGTTGIP